MLRPRDRDHAPTYRPSLILSIRAGRLCFGWRSHHMMRGARAWRIRWRLRTKKAITESP